MHRKQYVIKILPLIASLLLLISASLQFVGNHKRVHFLGAFSDLILISSLPPEKQILEEQELQDFILGNILSESTASVLIYPAELNAEAIAITSIVEASAEMLRSGNGTFFTYQTLDQNRELCDVLLVGTSGVLNLSAFFAHIPEVRELLNSKYTRFLPIPSEKCAGVFDNANAFVEFAAGKAKSFQIDQSVFEQFGWLSPSSFKGMIINTEYNSGYIYPFDSFFELEYFNALKGPIEGQKIMLWQSDEQLLNLFLDVFPDIENVHSLSGVAELVQTDKLKVSDGADFKGVLLSWRPLSWAMLAFAIFYPIVILGSISKIEYKKFARNNSKEKKLNLTRISFCMVGLVPATFFIGASLFYALVNGLHVAFPPYLVFYDLVHGNLFASDKYSLEGWLQITFSIILVGILVCYVLASIFVAKLTLRLATILYKEG